MNIDTKRLAADAAYWDELAIPEKAKWAAIKNGSLVGWAWYSMGDESVLGIEMIPRPQAPETEWVDGLPPAGSQCECYHTDLGGKKQWIGCDVVGPYGDYVICAPNGGGFYGFDAHELRPIRTPEQRQRGGA